MIAIPADLKEAGPHRLILLTTYCPDVGHRIPSCVPNRPQGRSLFEDTKFGEELSDLGSVATDCLGNIRRARGPDEESHKFAIARGARSSTTESELALNRRTALSTANRINQRIWFKRYDATRGLTQTKPLRHRPPGPLRLRH